MVSPPPPEPCHPRPMAPKPWPKPCHFKPNALPSRALALHPYAPHTKQPTPVAQPAPAEQPTLMAQPAPTAESASVAFQAAQIDPRLVQRYRLQIFEPTIILRAFSPYFFYRFNISQLKSRSQSLPHFHCSRRRIPSKLFQPKWRITLVSTSHRVDECPHTVDDLGELALAAH
ncbi:hypothetical protein ACFX14_007350 [Malus domestica]